MGGNIGELVNTNFIFSYVKICKITGILRGKTLITLCMYCTALKMIKLNYSVCKLKLPVK